MKSLFKRLSCTISGGPEEAHEEEHDEAEEGEVQTPGVEVGRRRVDVGRRVVQIHAFFRVFELRPEASCRAAGSDFIRSHCYSLVTNSSLLARLERDEGIDIAPSESSSNACCIILSREKCRRSCIVLGTRTHAYSPLTTRVRQDEREVAVSIFSTLFRSQAFSHFDRSWRLLLRKRGLSSKTRNRGTSFLFQGNVKKNPNFRIQLNRMNI